MYRTLKSHLMKGLLLISLFSFTSNLLAQDQENEDFEIFAAVSLVGGFSQQSGINANLDVIERYEDFIFTNLELRAQWKGFFIEQPGRSQEKVDGQFSGNSLGYNFYNSENWAYDLYAVRSSGSIRYGFRSPDDTITFERRSDYRVGVRATGYFEGFFTQFIATPLSLRSEIGGVELSASVRQNWQLRNWNIYNSIGVRYRSKEIIDHYYGVNDELSQEFVDFVQVDPNAENLAAYFAPYEGKAGISVNGEVGFEYPITEHWVFGGFFQYAVASDGAKDSPLFIGDRVRNAFGLSVTYVF